MAEAEEPVEGEDEAPKKKSKKGLIIGMVLALLLGGGGFFAVYSGMILAPASEEKTVAAEETVMLDLPPVAYVELDPLVISLGNASSNKHLRFRASLEVDPNHLNDVSTLKPRVLDVLNSYLRAVEISDLEDRGTLVSLRAQMLRRIQLVTGEGRVRDLLIIEFVLN